MRPHQIAVIIPFRDRGTDPLRSANLKRVLHEWHTFAGMPKPIVEHDGRTNGQFNRSTAYNRAVARTNADVLVFAESDMVLPPSQIHAGITAAMESPGLVVPFTQYRYLSPRDSERVRNHETDPMWCTPSSVMDNGTSIGAINIVSRKTLELVGRWDECFEGSWYDDRAMCRAFEICCGPTRYITGPAYHLFHLPGFKGDHLTVEDRQATARNKHRWKLYRQARTPEQIRALTCSA